jgi:NAD(P)-dependent dehydrogenase (short-subunit alcohol dehydrogenase family)
VAGLEAVARSESKVSLGRLGTPEDIADVVIFLMSEESRYMNGSVVEITGGMKVWKESNLLSLSMIYIASLFD